MAHVRHTACARHYPDQVRFLLALAVTAGIVPGVVPGVGAPSTVEPRDTETVIESVSPAFPNGVTLEVLGFDSYLRLRAPGREVQVPGYQNEPYLRIDRDGSVWLNEGSTTWVVNTDRYGNVDLSGFVPTTEPLWVRERDDATALWHDHRVHWMSEKEPSVIDDVGTIQDFTLPVVVDGVTHTVTGALYLRERASLAWWLTGLAATIVFVVLAVRRRGMFALVAPVAGVVAGVVGTVQWFGTEPGARVVPLLGAFGALAAVVGVVGLAIGRASRRNDGRGSGARGALMAAALNAGSGASLVLVAVLTSDHVQSAYVPGLEWEWVARAVVPVVLAAGVVATIDGAARVVRGDVRA